MKYYHLTDKGREQVLLDHLDKSSPTSGELSLLGYLQVLDSFPSPITKDSLYSAVVSKYGPFYSRHEINKLLVKLLGKGLIEVR